MRNATRGQEEERREERERVGDELREWRRITQVDKEGSVRRGIRVKELGKKVGGKEDRW
ncbi:hypothetical protein QTJ16_006062 [Diplocarpon rosae]|uniref:Uncharacterized protein n=1 Tax=Diplocarpon rosae TaxID=946125 RepID=A0AAD9SXE2_9HELO|nr:hypothetical protein QTJ16_006062 [Diplocarpon rosae]